MHPSRALHWASAKQVRTGAQHFCFTQVEHVSSSGSAAQTSPLAGAFVPASPVAATAEGPVDGAGVGALPRTVCDVEPPVSGEPEQPPTKGVAKSAVARAAR